MKKNPEKNYKPYSLYNQEDNANDNIKEEQEVVIPYKELLFLSTEFLKNPNMFFKKNYLLNSVCNLIANIFRTIWLELKNPAILISKIVEDFLNDVKIF